MGHKLDNGIWYTRSDLIDRYDRFLERELNYSAVADTSKNIRGFIEWMSGIRTPTISKMATVTMTNNHLMGFKDDIVRDVSSRLFTISMMQYLRLNKDLWEIYLL